MIAGMKSDDWLALNPSHPGEFIRDGVLDAVADYPGMTVSEAGGEAGGSTVLIFPAS